MTEPGGPSWRQSIYYPYFFASNFGRGTALELKAESPSYESSIASNVPYLDISAVHNDAEGTLTFFAINRNGQEPIDAEIDLAGFRVARVVDHQLMTHSDLRAANTKVTQMEVVPRAGTGAQLDDTSLNLNLPPYSYQMLRVEVERS
jgi:alpha-N-arabinofuranosidase